MKSTNTIIDSTNSIIESMSVILFPSGSESGSVPYDTRLETLFREFSVILEEKDKTIKTLQEKLAHVENERASLNLTSEISGQNTPPNFKFNECYEQKICQSNRNDNPDLKTQSTDESNKGDKVFCFPGYHVIVKSRFESINCLDLPPGGFHTPFNPTTL